MIKIVITKSNVLSFIYHACASACSFVHIRFWGTNMKFSHQVDIFQCQAFKFFLVLKDKIYWPKIH